MSTPSVAKLIHLLIDQRAKNIHLEEVLAGRTKRRLEPWPHNYDQARREIEAEVLKPKGAK